MKLLLVNNQIDDWLRFLLKATIARIFMPSEFLKIRWVDS
jgi:hypothetical protein